MNNLGQQNTVFDKYIPNDAKYQFAFKVICSVPYFIDITKPIADRTQSNPTSSNWINNFGTFGVNKNETDLTLIESSKLNI